MSDPSARYRIVRSLGRGGMGEVFLAEDVRLERLVALKFLPADLRDDARARERFEREAKAAAALDHPFICKIHEITHVDGQACIVMEYVDGETLAARVRRGRLDIKEALQLGVEIAEALEEAHRRRILHRDLKPANIMLTAQGHVKVMDFGLARRLPEAGVNVSQTQTVAPGVTAWGMRVGTPAYMSPEQALGAELDERSDLFSFGVMLHELLAGAHPFERGDPGATLAAIVREAVPPLRRSVPDAPDAVQVLISTLLAKEPADRYQSFRDVAGDLRRLRERLAGRAAATFASGAGTGERVASARTPYVGRDAERADLRRRLEQARAGHGSLVLVGGEPGVGKTRLVEELLAEARASGCLTLTGRCYETAGTPPFIAFVEVLEQAARAVPPGAFRELLGDAAPEVAKLLPELRRLFPDIPRPIELPPEQQRRYLFNSFFEFIERACHLTPQVVLLDDLHWADEPTLLLLQHLAQRLAQVRTLMVGTYRDVDLDVERPFAEMLETLTRQRLAHRVALKRLPENQVRAMLAALGGQHAPPDALVQVIYHETEGNPFFVEEVFHHLSDEGKLLDATGTWRTDLRIDELDVPEGVRLVIGRRLKRLRDETQRVLTVAALVGRAFDLRLLEAIAAQQGEALLAILEEAEGAHVIRSEEGREPRWLFAHELIRQTLVSKLSLPRRQRLHLQIADAIERRYASTLDRHVGDLAHHLYQAGAAADADRTVGHLSLAADQALAASAFEDALRYVEQALAIDEGTDDRRGADLRAKKGAALRSLGRGEDAIKEWETALSMYERLGDVDAVVRVCTQMTYQMAPLNRQRDAAEICARALDAVGGRPTAGRCRLLALAGVFVGVTGDYEAGIRLLQEAEHAAERLGNRHLLGLALSNRAHLLHSHGLFPDAVDVGKRAADELRHAGDVWELAYALCLHPTNLVCIGRLDEVPSCLDELRPLALRLGFHDVWLAHLASADRDLMRTGSLQAYEASVRQNPKASARIDTLASVSDLLVGAAQFWKGQWQESVASLESAIRVGMWPSWIELVWGWLFVVKAYTASPDALQVFTSRQAALPSPGKPAFLGSWYLAQLAVEGLAILGEKREAHALYPLLVRLMPMRVAGLAVGLVATSAGIAAACGADWTAAEQHFQTALRQAHEVPHKIAQPEARRWYAQMLLDRNAAGDRARAQTLLGEAIEMYRTIDMPRHLELAERMRERFQWRS